MNNRTTSGPARATDPARHVVVSASAGTGKTWLLVSRILRLLLGDVRPASILAITFTRKAAAEIQQRVHEALEELARAPDEALGQRLDQLALPADVDYRRRARALYERVLCDPHPVRATTFHAFCRELLRWFPLDARVPAGFSIAETTTPYEVQAWEDLWQEINAAPHSALAAAMDTLLRVFHSSEATRRALYRFVQHRSDWWTLTEGQRQPAAYALERLIRHSDAPHTEGPLFEARALRSALDRYRDLLLLHDTAGARARAAQLDQCGDELDNLRGVFLTAKDAPRHWKVSQSFLRRHGEATAATYRDLHEQLTEHVLHRLEDNRTRLNIELHRAWYHCGARLVEHFQNRKFRAATLDFADLEWHAYRLLSSGENARWLQYKLDQRIDHVLVDEFQDTNPTQWRLLTPLLEEIMAGDPERGRSVFIVGDGKQSIYGFRRADPRLFDQAHHWLARRGPTEAVALDASWRSSPAITDFANIVFGQAPHSEALGFRPHQTHRHGLWGEVRLLPLIRRRPPARAQGATALRNPLEESRTADPDTPQGREARQVAGQIRALLGVPVGEPARPLRYADVLILLRDRTHAKTFEQALRAAAIPYTGAGRGGLLECQEVRDLIDLLRVLGGDADLPLATVLHAPIFDCADQDLLALSGGDDERSWRERLHRGTAPGEVSPAAGRARELLAHWQTLYGRLPVHDLLDRIVHEGDLVARYEAALPAVLAARVAGTLSRVVELALDFDAGRYPSAERFIRYLEQREARGQAPDEPADPQGDRVRLMTIHAAKGLEAPAVFVVDCARTARLEPAFRVVVPWTDRAARPRDMRLITTQEALDAATRRVVQHETVRQEREQLRLLYVALTRAAQFLCISGSEAGRGKWAHSWYGLIESALRRRPDRPGLRFTIDGGARLRQGVRPPPEPPAPPRPDGEREDALPAPALKPAGDVAARIPSAASGDKKRGTLIHAMLAQLTDGTATATRILPARFSGQAPPDVLAACWREACAVLDDAPLHALIWPPAAQACFSEVPIAHRGEQQQLVHSVIDRLIVLDDRIRVVDYKTHPNVSPAEAGEHAMKFQEQMRRYAQGVGRLYPRRPVEAYILYTAILTAVPVATG